MTASFPSSLPPSHPLPPPQQMGRGESQTMFFKSIPVSVCVFGLMKKFSTELAPLKLPPVLQKYLLSVLLCMERWVWEDGVNDSNEIWAKVWLVSLPCVISYFQTAHHWEEQKIGRKRVIKGRLERLCTERHAELQQASAKAHETHTFIYTVQYSTLWVYIHVHNRHICKSIKHSCSAVQTSDISTLIETENVFVPDVYTNVKCVNSKSVHIPTRLCKCVLRDLREWMQRAHLRRPIKTVSRRWVVPQTAAIQYLYPVHMPLDI